MPPREHSPETSSRLPALVKTLVQELRETTEQKFIERAGIRQVLEEYAAAFGLQSANDLPSITGPRGNRSPQRQKMVHRSGVNYRDYILRTYDFMRRWQQGKPPQRPLPPEYRMAQELLLWIGVTPSPLSPSHDNTNGSTTTG
ncbi:hypothetical protein A2947_03190 [Candidatus Peribacteria bacterium RIFCSPLOWO2_01_FULL_54_110]|nr:MAG: hypothetical protein A2947_03190 [Candidatus Peribacteria bacterium RIFCSPLOWO2_01_FULL_54_110]